MSNCRIEIIKNKRLNDSAVVILPECHYFNVADIYGTVDPSIKSSIFHQLKSTGIKQLEPVIEDFVVIALSVFAVDKRFIRRDAVDAWTRHFELRIPVLKKQKWDAVKHKLEEILGFLSGDIWKLYFLQTDESLIKDAKFSPTIDRNYEYVSLFSGGLDSFCGAIKLFEEGKKVLFVGNEEYPKLRTRQVELLGLIQKEFDAVKNGLVTFTAKARSYYNINGVKSKMVENTTRTRSIIFLAGAIAFASVMQKKKVPVLIPENGFIGLNIPLTPSRVGSCSTRTTHPKFISSLNKVLKDVGIENEIINPFRVCSKKDMVNMVQHCSSFAQGAPLTISCSHPSNPRWYGKEYPKNCGYCYPCLIRKTSVDHLNISEDYTYDFNKDYNQLLCSDKKNDLMAMLNAAYNYKKNGRKYIESEIKLFGHIEERDVVAFSNLYEQTMQDFISLVKNATIKSLVGI